MPDRSERRVALIIVDMIGRFDFPEGPSLLRQATPAAGRIARLRERFHAGGAPVIYANDHRGQWRSDFREVIRRSIADDSPGAGIARLLQPEPDDYFVLKPMQSAFYQTPLPALLESLDIGRLVITGIASDACVLNTAADAHMRRYDVVVPADCSAAPSRVRHERALRLMRETMQVATPAGSRVRP